MTSPDALDSKDLTAKLSTLARDERSLLVDFICHLAEFDRRKLYMGLGHSSLFDYCTDRLGLSNGSTYRRIVAARLLPKFPAIAGFLSDGRISLAKLGILRDVLTEENHLDLLQRASTTAEKDVPSIVAELRPLPDVRDSIRKVPSRATSTPVLIAGRVEPDAAPRHDGEATSAVIAATASGAECPTERELAPNTASTVEAEAPASSRLELVAHPPSHRSRIEIRPTSPGTWAVTLSVGREFIDEFEQVKSALSHKFPDRDFEDVLRECFRVTLDAVERRRCGSARSTSSGQSRRNATSASHDASTCDAPSNGVATSAAAIDGAASSAPTSADAATACGTIKQKPSRYIPAAVRREVWRRDGGTCAFVGHDGRRCGSRHQVQVHHVKPFASGGPPTVDNLSLRCRVHNVYEAELAFGAEFMRSQSLPSRKCGPQQRASTRDERPSPKKT